MTDQPYLPNPCDFRQWVRRVLGDLDVSAYRWCLAAGVAPNLVSKILSGEQTDLRLGAASALVEAASRLAQEQGRSLPPLVQDVPKQSDPLSKGDGNGSDCQETALCLGGGRSDF